MIDTTRAQIPGNNQLSGRAANALRDVGAFSMARARTYRDVLLGIWGHARAIRLGLPHLRLFGGNPAFFEFERRGANRNRLGPGLSRESDSFWPLSEW